MLSEAICRSGSGPRIVRPGFTVGTIEKATTVATAANTAGSVHTSANRPMAISARPATGC